MSGPIKVERGPFEMVPHWLLNTATLSSNAIRLWLVLRQHGDETKTSFPGRGRLARAMGASRATVTRAIQELHDVGALCYRQRQTHLGDWGSNEYHLHWDKDDDCGYFTRGLPSPPVDYPSPPVDHPSPPVSHELRLDNPDCSNSDSPKEELGGSPSLGAALLDHEQRAPAVVLELRPKGSSPSAAITNHNFEEFWQAYPRKVGKGKAREAYGRALRSTDAATIAEQARRYAHSVRAKDPQYIPYPTTWLNQERWADDLPEVRHVPEGWLLRPDGIMVDGAGRLWDKDGCAL